MAHNRFEIVLRFGIGAKAHESIMGTVRRENGAVKERDALVEGTIENLREHCPAGGRVIYGTLATDPNAITCTVLRPDGTTYDRVVTYRPIVRPDVDDGLEDALLASLMVVNG